MTISLERKLSSVELRTLLPEVMNGTAIAMREARAVDLMTSMAGGDEQLALKAVQTLLARLQKEDASPECASTIAIMGAFIDGLIDLVEINPEGEMVWCASHSEEEAGS